MKTNRSFTKSTARFFRRVAQALPDVLVVAYSLLLGALIANMALGARTLRAEAQDYIKEGQFERAAYAVGAPELPKPTLGPPTPTYTLTPSQTPTAIPPSPTPSLTPTAVPPNQISRPALPVLDTWAHIICGEAGNGWPEGAQLIAWTMRTQVVLNGWPAEKLGPAYGWYAWCEAPEYAVYQAAKEALHGDLTQAPFAFIREGHRCVHLGSSADRRYWEKIGYYQQPPNVVLTFAAAPSYTMNCYFREFGRD